MICVGKEGLVGISVTYIEAWVVALEERSRVVSPAEARSVPGFWSLPVLLLLTLSNVSPCHGSQQEKQESR